MKGIFLKLLNDRKNPIFRPCGTWFYGLSAFYQCNVPDGAIAFGHPFLNLLNDCKNPIFRPYGTWFWGLSAFYQYNVPDGTIPFGLDRTTPTATTNITCLTELFHSAWTGH